MAKATSFPRTLSLAQVPAAALLLVLALVSPCDAVSRVPGLRVLFIRGDANASGKVDVSDPIVILYHLFLGGSAPPCLKAADLDASGAVDVSDPVYLLNHLFLGGPPPEAPYPSCGSRASPELLPCDGYLPCEFESVREAFSVIERVAGKAEPGPVDSNRWDPAYEGGKAIDAQLSTPHFAMADRAGNLYIADKDAHAVRRVAPDGRITTVAGMNEPGDDGDGPAPGTAQHLRGPNGLWVRGDGTVYILDTDNGRVTRLDTAGMMSTFFRVDGGIRTGRGLWVSEDESLAYFASRTLLGKWTPQKGVEDATAGIAFRQLGNLVPGEDGRLLVTDRDANRVYRVTATGGVEVIAGNGFTSGGGDGKAAVQTGLFGVRGVWPLVGAGYFLATHQGSQVWYVDTGGTIHLFLDGRPDNQSLGDGEDIRSLAVRVTNIRGIAMDPSGNLLIVENDFGAVRRVVRR